MTRAFTFALAATMGVAATSASKNASAFCRITTDEFAVCGESGVPVFWSTACLSYAVDVDGSQWLTQPQTWAAVDAAFGAWAEVTCDGEPTSFRFLRQEDSICATFEYNAEGPNVNTIAFLDPWVDPRNGLAFDPLRVATTSVSRNLSTGEILDVDMLINDTSPFGDCAEEDPCTVIDLRSIVTHEAGHFLGFNHSPFASATMFAEPPAVDDIELRSLEEDDRNALCETYPPGPLESQCSDADFEPRGGLDLDCTDAPMTNGGCTCSTVGASALQNAQLVLWLLALGYLRARKRTSHFLDGTRGRDFATGPPER